MSTSAAQQLVELISQAVKDIEIDTATQLPGATTSNINSPIVAPEDKLEATPKRRDAIRTLQASTHQLLATLMPAGSRLISIYSSYFEKVAIDIVVTGRIADLIHTADPDLSDGGVHVEVISEKAGMDPQKLTHVLRFLALRNIFCEVTKNHWINTRCSVPLRTDSQNSICNLLMHFKEVALPALLEFPRVMLDTENGGALSWDHSDSAFQKHFKPGCDPFEFMASTDGGYRAERFGKAMVEVTKALGNGEAEYKSYDWKKLGPQGTLIDVGGGIGAAAYDISTYLPEWKIVVQDRAEVAKDERQVSFPLLPFTYPAPNTERSSIFLEMKNYQKIASTANIEFEEADFLKGQPEHRLRKAAKPTTRLMICETTLEPPLLDRNSPILLNGGMATHLSHNFNITMLIMMNAEERSTETFSEIFDQSGWKLQSVSPLATVLLDRCIFEAVPNTFWKD
ncbi:hypothetical protein PTTG_02436 [Puccinia triticina 1-1 BBBD Race 1]|uniref:Methyltransf_2 domain-containing protein n=2 Tax=Puccinia triticina TaxID=208348 RepID=A0A180H1W9_PUCT1|nr:uncharacterized protein PtA15_4A299 [Puccinia triticina]OAV99020.1 hypothetical protein PTTG_02436 [Puccinia triticina 1-1 BBBD Race 1]WAQ83850.1 hypothetical protein PtA15_4A299 [Puccinia triticina]